MSPARITHDGAAWSNAREDGVHVVDHDPGWGESFATEAASLRAALPGDVPWSIEHFGSTAVPGLAAKPVVDIMVVCGERSAWARFRDPIESLGYVFWAENPEPDHMFFVKGMPPYGEARTHHVHVRLPRDAERHLRFRDALRRSPPLAARYAALKRVLAERHRHDREAYTEGKTAFVEAVLDGEADGPPR